jgi:hypothetical protein
MCADADRGSGTGEHGVGVGKKEYLYDELGEGTVELMKRIKVVMDPLGLMNPGKVCVALAILRMRAVTEEHHWIVRSVAVS